MSLLSLEAAIAAGVGALYGIAWLAYAYHRYLRDLEEARV